MTTPFSTPTRSTRAALSPLSRAASSALKRSARHKCRGAVGLTTWPPPRRMRRRRIRMIRRPCLPHKPCPSRRSSWRPGTGSPALWRARMQSFRQRKRGGCSDDEGTNAWRRAESRIGARPLRAMASLSITNAALITYTTGQNKRLKDVYHLPARLPVKGPRRQTRVKSTLDLGWAGEGHRGPSHDTGSKRKRRCRPAYASVGSVALRFARSNGSGSVSMWPGTALDSLLLLKICSEVPADSSSRAYVTMRRRPCT